MSLTLQEQMERAWRMADSAPSKPLVVTSVVRQLCKAEGITPEELSKRMGLDGVVPELRMPQS